MPASRPIPLEGVLNCWNDEHDLPDLLLAVIRTGKTGRLQFSNPEGDKTLNGQTQAQFADWLKTNAKIQPPQNCTTCHR